MSRGSMTMRATIERRGTLGTDGYGQDGTPPFVAEPGLESVPCWAWSTSRVDVTKTDKRMVLEDMRAIFPSSADVQRHDRLVIEDRLGVSVFGGPVAVLSLTPKGATGVNYSGHVEAMLERHV